jgi:ribose-phosphate pyrophosphokinase
LEERVVYKGFIKIWEKFKKRNNMNFVKGIIMNGLGIIICESGRHFAEKVVAKINERIKKENKEEVPLIKGTKEVLFANGEVKTEILESIRDKDIFIFQDVTNKTKGFSLNDNLMILKTAIDSARRSDAKSINVVIPYFPYARQDKAKTRECITAELVAREIENAGANRVIVLDIHNEAIAGFFRLARLENLRASKQIIEYIKENIPIENLEICSPDAGGLERAEFYAKKLGVPANVLLKKRDYSKANTVEKVYLLGDVEGKDIFIIDDMIDTAGTIIKGAEELKKRGANKIYFGASHGLLSGPAVERLNKAFEDKIFEGIVVTNTIHQPENVLKAPWYNEVNLEGYFAKVIYNLYKRESISKLLE